MRNALVVIAIFIRTSASIAADEVVLKDGKKIEWKTMKDLGDTVELETVQGTKVTVKKSDVEKVLLTAPRAVLTGAAFTFDAKKQKLETTDLMAKVDTSKGIAGDFRTSGGTLTLAGSNAMVHSKLPIAMTPPEEYDLTLIVERKQGNEDIFVGLIAGGHQFTFHIDAYNSSKSGPVKIDGKDLIASDASVNGKILAPGKPRVFTFMVRKGGLVIKLDQKDWFAWAGDWNTVTLEPLLAVPERNQLFLGCLGSTFLVSKITLLAPKN